MDARRLMLPAAALVGAAVLGRLIGLKGLVRAGMAALTVANMSKTAGLLTDEAPPRRNTKRNGRGGRKRMTRKSVAKKTATAH
jgi:transposase-like protein